MKKIYSIFIADYTIWNSPSLINFLELLRRNGKLYVFVTNTFNRNIEFLKNHQFDFFIIEKTPFEFSLKNMYYQIRSLFYFLKYKIISKNFDLNICIDVKGFCQFLRLGNLKTSLLYYSLELQLLNDNDPDRLIAFLKPYQELERNYTHKISGVIIQSETRKEAFYKDYLLKEKLPCFLLPVTNNGECVHEKKNYIREKYNISTDKKIVLYIGGIHPYYKVKEIVCEMAKSKDSILFLHGFYESTYITEIQELVKRNNFLNIIFSSEIFDEIERTNIIYQSADIGVAWYEYDSLNFKTAAWSSGKIAGYLRFGIPVIVNDGSGGQKVINETNCGISINNSSELLPAISKILNNYEFFSDSCLEEFNKTYRFSNYENKLINFVNSL